MDLTIILLAMLSALCAVCEEYVQDTIPLQPNFQKAVKSKYYIDKTLGIKHFLENPYHTIFLSAPRKFGKSINLQMIKHFLEIPVNKYGKEIKNKKNTSNYELFRETQLFKHHPEFFHRHFGQHPVVYVNYGQMEYVSSGDTLMEALADALRKTFYEHVYLLDVYDIWSERLEGDNFRKVIAINTNEKLNVKSVTQNFMFLSALLTKHFGKAPILLIDEYESYVNSIMFRNGTYVDNVSDMFHAIHRPLFEHFMPVFEKVLCTGVFHITGSGMALVNKPDYMADYQFLHDHKFVEFFGMTDQECVALLNQFTNDTSEAQQFKLEIDYFYKGYTVFGRGTNVYNTYSVLSYLHSIQSGSSSPLQSYCVRPRFYKEFLRLFYDTDVKLALIDLLQLKPALLWSNTVLSKVEVRELKRIVFYSPRFIQRDVVNMIYYLFLLNGYLTYSNVGHVEEHYTLEIPNYEIRKEIELILFDTTLQQHGFEFNKVVEISNMMNNISEKLSSKSSFEKIALKLNEILDKSSYNSTNENDFHTTFATLLRYKFRDNVTFDSTFRFRTGYVTITVTNEHDVTFYIESKTIIKKRLAKIADLQRCATEVGDRVYNRFYVHTATNLYGHGIVFMGVCVVLTRPTAIDSRRVQIRLGYSTNLGTKDLTKRKFV